MNKIRISDVTMKQAAEGFSLSFKEKIELAKLLDKLGTDVIELEGIENPRVDSLRIKSVAAAVQESTVAVPVKLCKESIDMTWNALQLARHPRLQVCAPVSAVQMEYLFHKKPDAMRDAVAQAVAACKALCPDVEFVAEDATRADMAYLTQVLEAATQAGATTVTLCDTAGTMLPAEFAGFIREVAAGCGACLAVACADTLSMADACAIAAVAENVQEVKTAAYPLGCASLANVARILQARGDAICQGVCCGIHTAQLSRTIDQIAWMCQADHRKGVGLSAEETDSGIFLTAHDSLEAVAKAVEQLGYDLSDEDKTKVYAAFQTIAAKKEKVGIRELDAIVASSAMQVPSSYVLDTYVINSGNTISSCAQLRLSKEGRQLDGVCLGDGPIDAAFQAIESITGCHYELDDFQIQAVTEGREAMAQAIVRLRSGGRLYAGRGISTDIVGASIQAYLSALNKIVYEEAEV